MPVEVQKDITFEGIREGDLIVVEMFGADGFTFLGDRRGVAVRKVMREERQRTEWHFDGMTPLYAFMTNYRLFRVEPPTEAETELDRLRKIEAALKDLIALRKEVLRHVRAQIVTERDNGYFYGINGVIELKEKVIQLRTEISTLEELLE